MIQLYDYQVSCVEKIRHQYRSGSRAPLFVLATGGGKTVLFSYMTLQHINRGGVVLILVHRQELIDQVSQTLHDFGVQHKFIAPNYPQNYFAKVQVGSVFTVARRIEKMQPPTLIIVDEAHHCTGQTTFGKVLSAFPRAYKLGVTATPFRLSGEGLNDHFDSIVVGPSVQELIDRGRLSRFRMFCPSAPDLSTVHKRHGDFLAKELEVVVDRPSITGDAVTHYHKHASGRQAVAFCVSVDHAKHVSDSFMAAGYPAQSIDGSLPREWRRQIVGDFRNRKIKILTSCDLISEGFDVPGIEVGIFLRPTMSLGLWRQQLGRALRTAPDKTEAILLDAAGNALRHGLPTDEIEYTLEGHRRKANTERAPSVRICKKCFAANRAAVHRCVQCGTEFEAKPREVSKRKGDLEELTPERRASILARRQQGMANSLAALIDLGRLRGYKEPERWAQHVWDAKKLKKHRQVSF